MPNHEKNANHGLPLTFCSPAKVNLYLRVGRPRQDGFHPIVSWFCSLTLSDKLVIKVSDSGEVNIACNRADVPCDDRNLIMKAAQMLRPLARRFIPVQIDLQKNIPAGGGLGGGSSNAAVALKALSDLWACDLNHHRLHLLAEKLGSDVPFFLQLPSAICRGRGELVQAFPAPVSRGILLLFPGIAMPTPQVYRKFDEMNLGTDLAIVEQSLPRADLPADQLLNLLVNDLEAPAFAISPALARLRESAEDLLKRPVRMSGSGSTLFTLYDSVDEAKAMIPRFVNTGMKAQAFELGRLP